MAHFDLQLLDRWLLTCQSQRIPLRLREQRVICLLALRSALSRRRLAGLLWPESTEARALDSLRVSLHHIHRQAPQLIISSEGWLEISEQTTVDLHQLRSELERWGANPNLNCTQVQQLLLNRELLPDWDAPWLAIEQEQLRQLRAQTLQACAVQLLESGQSRFAVALARAALALDPISESAANSLARAEAGAGNRASAAAGLLVFIEHLRAELGIAPGPELTHTLAQLRSH